MTSAPTRSRKLFIKTYGCQMNVYDSERMTEALAHSDYVSVDRPEEADAILLNTCHIREKAAEKVYSELGRYRRLKATNPGLKIGVAGCVAQAEGEEIVRRQPAVDLVVGPRAYHRLPDLMEKANAGEKAFDTDFPEEDKFDHLKARPRQTGRFWMPGPMPVHGPKAASSRPVWPKTTRMSEKAACSGNWAPGAWWKFRAPRTGTST